ncbi:glutathione S-transferase N-terminal domain-containing protein [Pendulispora albinea]|uniref:glutathione transferase n=1 Tax=Pendulispora albinea TaxID=2741071 RepID=A0ABZ2LUP7_9BACT
MNRTPQSVTSLQPVAPPPESVTSLQPVAPPPQSVTSLQPVAPPPESVTSLQPVTPPPQSVAQPLRPIAHRLVLVSEHLCPYVQRVAIVLAEKGIPFERVFVDLSNKPAWFTDISPLGKTPLLRVDDHVIFESAVICEYVEDISPEHPLHPRDPLARANRRAWMAFGSEVLNDIAGLETTTDPSVFERKRSAIATKFRRMERALGPGPYFAGDDFSLVDAVFGPVFRYFDVFDSIADTGVFREVPRVNEWRAALKERPSVRAAVGADYPERLRAFLARKNAYLLSYSAESPS